MAVRTLWKFVVGRAKTFIKNYNVLERAEKLMESDKRVPPRHPGTEAKFKVLVKERPDSQADVDRKHVELLDRLKIVKVSSEDGIEDDQKEYSRPLPQMRRQQELPAFGLEEPKSISEGKCSLRQALEFISNNQNDPSTHTIQSIADAHKMKSSDVEQVIENFRAFTIFVSHDKKVGFSKKALKTLGIGKVVHPMYSSKFKEIEKEAVKSTVDKK